MLTMARVLRTKQEKEHKADTVVWPRLNVDHFQDIVANESRLVIITRVIGIHTGSRHTGSRVHAVWTTSPIGEYPL